MDNESVRLGDLKREDHSSCDCPMGLWSWTSPWFTGWLRASLFPSRDSVSPLSHQGFDLMLYELPVCDAKPEGREWTVWPCPHWPPGHRRPRRAAGSWWGPAWRWAASQWLGDRWASCGQSWWRRSSTSRCLWTAGSQRAAGSAPPGPAGPLGASPPLASWRRCTSVGTWDTREG